MTRSMNSRYRTQVLGSKPRIVLCELRMGLAIDGLTKMMC